MSPPSPTIQKFISRDTAISQYRESVNNSLAYVVMKKTYDVYKAPQYVDTAMLEHHEVCIK